VPNSIHHVIQRGNNRTYIYEDTRDKRQFLSILSEALEHYGATLLHYVLMDNHYHLLLRLGAHPLSQLIWYVNRHYTLYYNRRYNRIGTIYGGRFLSYLMGEQAKLYSTVRYIVRNPVKAQMVDEPSRYRWSGHKAVLDGDASILDREELLKCFAPEPAVALARYRECTESTSWSAEVGFATIIDRSRETTERLSCLLDRFLAERDLSVMRSMIVSGGRSTVIRNIRESYALLAIRDGHALKDVATFLNVSHETVRRVVINSLGSGST
jgi:REP element-mobilizing transposase RayT